RAPRLSPLFPYTTLFRSARVGGNPFDLPLLDRQLAIAPLAERQGLAHVTDAVQGVDPRFQLGFPGRPLLLSNRHIPEGQLEVFRSEERRVGKGVRDRRW